MHQTENQTQSDLDQADPLPGRPKKSGSRQQTRSGQTSSSGSPSFDDEATRGGAGEQVPIKPAGAK